MQLIGDDEKIVIEALQRVPVEDACSKINDSWPPVPQWCSSIVVLVAGQKSLLDAMVLQPGCRIENEWNEWNNRYYIVTFSLLFFFFYYSFSMLFDYTDNRRGGVKIQWISHLMWIK